MVSFVRMVGVTAVGFACLFATLNPSFAKDATKPIRGDEQSATGSGPVLAVSGRGLAKLSKFLERLAEDVAKFGERLAEDAAKIGEGLADDIAKIGKTREIPAETGGAASKNFPHPTSEEPWRIPGGTVNGATQAGRCVSNRLSGAYSGPCAHSSETILQGHQEPTTPEEQMIKLIWSSPSTLGAWYERSPSDRWASCDSWVGQVSNSGCLLNLESPAAR